ncbi:60S ribosomal protein L19 [Stachybotrys elegans]|uniref:60S ribosomal protein L19 n=1 Tax=Stachybotrys elegans TaxID=80388 RepID=A0A8K0T1M2_9HYPO|nr:60S ribosomal protein L19 [Stachybotrys elegans]
MSSPPVSPPATRPPRGFIRPRSTGERSRRQFTLRTSSSFTRESTRENTAPLETSPEYAETFRERFDAFGAAAKDSAVRTWAFFKTEEGRGVLKCTLAYLLGSTATFWSPLSNFLGHRDGKHIVATLTVYFHPARTAGSMLEAVLIAITAVVYAELVCLMAMAVSIASRSQFGHVTPAHIFVLFICIGGGLGFVGWVKQRINQPLVNTASTLASIAIISVLTKEDSVREGFFSGEKMTQMLKMLLLGISFTSAVNLLVWRVSAREQMRTSFTSCAVALSDKISFITRGFIEGSEDAVKSSHYARVSARYNSSYSSVTKGLRESKFEHYFLGNEKIYKLDKRLVKSLEALSQAIGGLHSALQTQFTLLRETPQTDPLASGLMSPTGMGTVRGPTFMRSFSGAIESGKDRLSVIDESTEDDRQHPPTQRTRSDASITAPRVFQAPSDIFELFIQLLGPSLKSLAYTLSETLREPPFGDDPTSEVAANDQLRESLRDALNLFNDVRGSALQELYRSIELGRSRSEAIQADIEEVAAACGHFSFSLQAVAEEIDSYLDVLEELKHVTETNGRSWNWMKFWTHFGGSAKSSTETESLLPKPMPVKSIRKSALPKGIPDEMVTRRDTFSWDAAPQTSKYVRAVSENLLKVLRFLAKEDILFGIKVGIGAILWAQFAFIPATRPIYEHWRGEWGLLSFMIVVGMTTGAANTSGTARFLGTLMGGTCACLSWLLAFENPYLLALFGWLVALGSFYLILVVKNGPLGRICLLAYNVIVLYAYSLSQKVDDDDDDEGGAHPFIFNITYHRVVAVTLGILWGMIVCRVLWPISGRRKFREGLAVLYLQLGLIWKRGPLGVMLHSKTTLDYMREGEQAALQRYAFKLESLRDSAKSEFELRGPFPYESYGRIMNSTKNILNGFYAMRLISQKRLTLSDGERDLIEFVEPERQLLCQRICHVFQVLASCIMLEYPLTDAIPTVDNIKDRLLGKIYIFRKEHMEHQMRNGGDLSTIAQEQDYALMYAYTLVTAQVAAELKKVRLEIEMLFGVLNEEALLLQ